MSGRYWLLVIALGGYLVAPLSASSALEPADLNQPGQATGGDPSAADIQDEPPPEVSPLANSTIVSVFERIATALEAIGTNPKTKREEKRAETDLKAQTDMAFWAMWVFIAAAIQAVITAIGIYYVRNTLKATRDAVAETKAATAVTATAVSDARRNAERELRAYFAVVPGPLRISDGLYVRLIQSNVGQTPARNVRLWAQAVIRPTDLPKNHKFPKLPRVGGTTVVHPNQSFFAQLTTVGTDKNSNYSNIVNQDAKCRLYVFAEVTYEDYTGRERRARACWYYVFSGKNVATEMRNDWFSAVFFFADQHNLVEDDCSEDEQPEEQEPTQTLRS